MLLRVAMSKDRPFSLGGAHMGMNLELEVLRVSADACQVSKKGRNFLGEEGEDWK